MTNSEADESTKITAYVKEEGDSASMAMATVLATQQSFILSCFEKVRAYKWKIQ